MDFVKRAAEIREQIIADRRYLHQHPEFGMERPTPAPMSAFGWRAWTTQSRTVPAG